MRRVRWAFRARQDVIQITDYFASRAPDFPERLLDRIDALARLLADHPNLGARAGGTAYRKFRIGRTEYILLYKVTGRDIVIARVRHAREAWRSF